MFGRDSGALCRGGMELLLTVTNTARAIQDQLLKDFGAKSEFSDWFSREDEPVSSAKPKRPVVIEPNPINIEHEQKIAALEARIKRFVAHVEAGKLIQRC